MKKALFILLIIFLLGRIIYDYSCKQKNNKGIPEIQEKVSPVSVREKTQAQKVASLEKALQGTLLASQSAMFVATANQYGFDYRLLPAISFSESGLCDHFLISTFNCWGWGNGKISFSSFEDAIGTIGYKLATLPAYEAWREDKDNLSALAARYCFVNKIAWERTVRIFMEKVEEL